MSNENHMMPARGGEVGFKFPDEESPPRGTKLLIINAGGCLLVSDWQDGCGHLQWSHPPKARKRPKVTKLPFSLASLQALMADLHGMSARDTLKHASSLYEKGLATYPRTEDEYVMESCHREAAAVVAAVGRAKWLAPLVPLVDLRLKSCAFDDTKVVNALAIIPTASEFPLEDLDFQERLVFTEIAKRYLMQFLHSADVVERDFAEVVQVPKQ